MVLEQAALTHDIERIFRSKKSEKTFQNDEGAKQHIGEEEGEGERTSSTSSTSTSISWEGQAALSPQTVSRFPRKELDVVAHLTSSSPAVRNSMRWAEDKAILRWEDIPDSGTDPQRG